MKIRSPPTVPSVVSVNGAPPKVVQQFCYLGCILTPACQIHDRVNLVSSAFGRLHSRKTAHLRTKTKLAFCQSVRVHTVVGQRPGLSPSASPCRIWYDHVCTESFPGAEATSKGRPHQPFAPSGALWTTAISQ